MASVAWDDEAKPGPQAPQIQWDAPAAAPAESSAVTRAYQSVAKPVTGLLARILEPTVQGVTAPFVDMQRYANGEAPGQILRNSATFRVGAERPGAALPAAQSIAEVAVPQTPLQAGMMVGTMGAAPAARAIPAVAALAKAHPALTRILGGTAGGSVGGAVGDEGAARGAGEGFVGSTFGEGLGALLSRLRLAIPGGKRAANNADAARIGQTVGEIVPPLKGNTTVPSLRDMTEGGGQAALGAAKDAANADIAAGIGAREGNLRIPAIGQTVMETKPIGMGGTHQVETTKPMTLQEANDALSEAGKAAFSKNPLDRTFAGVDQRQRYGDIRRGINESLDWADPTGYSAGQFDKAQSAYSGGMKVLDLFKRSGVVNSDGFLDVARLQRMLNNPKNAAILQHHLGDEGFQKLTDSVYRGAPRGETDRLPSGQGGALDALMQLLRGTNTGFSQSWRVPIATALPNVGAKYVGKNPLALPEGLRTILDVGAQKGVDQVAR